jgi:iduronate 2-sulfatase
MMMSDQDNKSAPQLSQRVEYAHRLATRTIEYMAYAKAAKKNFYIGIGIRKPHLPWRHPRKFWDMYEGKALTTAKHQTIGENITTLAFERNGGPGYSGVFDGIKFGETPNHDDGLGALPEELQADLRRGYYASVSFMDFEVGRVLGELDVMGFADNTAVLFHADHGWKLGEHGDWSKCTNWELDARVPLIIRAPWIEASVAQKTLAIAELIDLFPTLVELAGLPLPPASEGLEGTSLLPVLNDPGAAGAKKMAFSQYPRCPEYSLYTDPVDYECLNIAAANISHMGFSVRVDAARYTEWRRWKPSCVGDWSGAGLVAQELYDHAGDPGVGPHTFDDFEFVNLAYEPSQEALVARLAAVLRMQFAHASTTCPPPNHKGYSVLED